MIAVCVYIYIYLRLNSSHSQCVCVWGGGGGGGLHVHSKLTRKDLQDKHTVGTAVSLHCLFCLPAQYTLQQHISWRLFSVLKQHAPMALRFSVSVCMQYPPPAHAHTCTDTHMHSSARIHCSKSFRHMGTASLLFDLAHCQSVILALGNILMSIFLEDNPQLTF